MYKPLLSQIFDRELKNHNGFESLSLPLHFLTHLNDPITLTWLTMVEIMLVNSINVSNVAILPILNGTVPFTNVEHADKQHQDMRHEPVMDVSMMMESTDITTLMATKMEILPENVNLHWLLVLIYFPNHSKSRTILLLYKISLFLPLFPQLSNKLFTMFLPLTSRFNPTIYPSTNKPYPPAILVKHHTWFLHDADLFISCDHILYGVHQSHFDQSPLFREIILYGRTNKIGVNPYHPIPFDTLIKEVFNNLLHILYFGTEHLEHLTPEDWLNIKCLSTNWHFPRVTATIVRTLVTFWRRFIPPPLQIMANSLPVYQIFDEQERLSRRICGRIIIVEESSDEEETVIEDNNS
jgi:hypothetical protein